MPKGLLILLLVVATAISAFLAYRLRVQAEEFAQARETVGWLHEENEVLSLLLNDSGMDQETARAILKKAYPDSSLGPYTRQIVINGVDLHFTRDSIFHISAQAGGWACGPLLGCESTYDQPLSSSVSRASRSVIGFVEAFAYPLLALGFFGGGVLLWRRRRTLSADDLSHLAAKVAVALFAFGVFVAWASGEMYMDAVFRHGVSPELLDLGWDEVGRRLLIGLVLATVLGLFPFITKSRAA